ncbi:hypothetical protein ACFVWR_04285 [Leifsonia sp. NPDC058292]|uniref:hypothetical protein n=1 Tax=Leifsonia sp. NPDC058292 TaxID=3346428 RepID=UPI0036D98973
MLRISTIDGGVIDVDSSLMTIDDGVIAWWRSESEEAVARWRLDEVVGVQVLVEDPIQRARREHPNAYRRWTIEEEAAVVEAFARGEAVKEIAAATGRRVGGIRSRLIALGVIEPAPGDRVSVPSSAVPPSAPAPAVPSSAVQTSGGEAGVEADRAVV